MKDKINRFLNDRTAGRFLPFYLFTFLLLLISCARMGSPDGGWYDDDPPRVIGCSPADKATNVTSKKITIYFDEFIKIDNPTQNVIVSPPQLEMPEIKAQGKKIVVAPILLTSAMPSATTTRAIHWATIPIRSLLANRSTLSRWQVMC